MIPGTVNPDPLAFLVGSWAATSAVWTPFPAIRSVHRLFDRWPAARLGIVRDRTRLPNPVRMGYDVHRSP